MSKQWQIEGLDFRPILEKYDKATGDIQKAAQESVNAIANYCINAWTEKLKSHKRTGAAIEALTTRTRVDSTGARADVGAFYDDDEKRAGYMHAVYQEYGSPTFKKDPWFRTTVDRIPSVAKKIVKQKLAENGVEPK